MSCRPISTLSFIPGSHGQTAEPYKQYAQAMSSSSNH